VLDVEVEPVRSLKTQILPIFGEALKESCQENFANAIFF
jgi:hypothetical protein